MIQQRLGGLPPGKKVFVTNSIPVPQKHNSIETLLVRLGGLPPGKKVLVTNSITVP